MVHCRSASPTPKVRPMDGKATFTAVESRKTTPEPSTMANKTHLPRALEKLRPWGDSASFSCLCTLHTLSEHPHLDPGTLPGSSAHAWGEALHRAARGPIT